jgi:hypothetical protein
MPHFANIVFRNFDDAHLETLLGVSQSDSRTAALERETSAFEFRHGKFKKGKPYVNFVGDSAEISQRKKVFQNFEWRHGPECVNKNLPRNGKIH